MAYKLGKSNPTKISFKFKQFASTLTPPPTTAGTVTPPVETNMFMNDQLGDCVCAGAAHETLHWNLEGGLPVTISDSNVLAMYSAVAGYDPNDPSTDQGTDMSVAASWRRKTGLVDSEGRTHKVAAYMSLTPKNATQLRQAIYHFGAVGVGVKFPSTAMKQFEAGLPWTPVCWATIEGGHYVAAVGYDSHYVYVMTWGKLQKMSWSFYTKYNDEAFAYLSTEMLKDGTSPEGFKIDQLQTALAELN